MADKQPSSRATALRDLHSRLDPKAPKFMKLADRAKAIRDLLDGLAERADGGQGTGEAGGEVKPEAVGKPEAGTGSASGQAAAGSGAVSSDAAGVRFGSSERAGRVGKPAAGSRNVDKFLRWLIG